MAIRRRLWTAVALLFFLVALAALIPIGLALLYGARTVRELLTENKRLKDAISNLTQEEQIGYAKVVDQQRRDGRTYTTLRFVETAPGAKLQTVLEKEFSIEGDVVYFDALIVRFGNQMVMDGRERALYLWRRVYGEGMPPRSAYPIEDPGAEPKRYADLLRKLPVRERDMFWTAIWNLANDPQTLKEYGITAVYGNAVYSSLRPGLIYVFKITPTGQVYPEVVPDI
jgi:hypothetical protein